MTAFAVAVERRHWTLVSLYLLLSVAETAQKLPPESLSALLDLLDANPDGPRKPRDR